MGVMEAFRNSTKYIMYLLILSFGVLWALADTQVFDAVMSGPRSLGTVNDEAISFEAYNNRIQYYTERYREQTGDSPTPELRAYYEETAWNDLVSALVVKQKMDHIGIDVSEQELIDMITGPNPDPFIVQQFTDSLGQFNRAALQNAIESTENTKAWIMVESQLSEQRRQRKLNMFLESGLVVGKKDVEDHFVRANSVADAKYVRFALNDVPDSTISVTDAELKDYLKKNSAKYQQKKSFRFSYITIDTTPTAEDTAIVVNELNEIRARFATAKNDSIFMVQNQSENKFAATFVKKDEIKEAFKPLFSLKKGEVSEPIVEGGKVHVLKLTDIKTVAKNQEYQFQDFSRSVKADPFGTMEKANQQADDFIFYANESGFKKEAERLGLQLQNGFATEGNAFVAGLGQSRQILSFLERAKVGKVSEPYELPNKMVVLHLDEIIPAGTRPFDEVKTQLERAVKADKRKAILSAKVKDGLAQNNTLDALAVANGKQVQTASSLRYDATVVPGVGRENGFIGAIFAAEPGAEPKMFIGETAVFVFQTTTKQMADVTTLSEAQRDEIKTKLKQEISQLFSRAWVDQMIAEANVEDFRRLLLR